MSRIPPKDQGKAHRGRRCKPELGRDEFYWPDELESLLTRFHASGLDLPELDPDSAKSASQYRYAVRAREMFLVGRIRELVKIGDEDAAAQAVCDLLAKAMLFTDAPDWIWINKRRNRWRFA